MTTKLRDARLDLIEESALRYSNNGVMCPTEPADLLLMIDPVGAGTSREREAHNAEAARLLWDECSPHAPDWAYAPPADEAAHAGAIDAWLVAEHAIRAAKGKP